MFRKLVPVLVGALLVAGCSSPAAAVPPTVTMNDMPVVASMPAPTSTLPPVIETPGLAPTEPVDPEGGAPDAVIAAFKAAGLEAEAARPMTKDDYGAAPLVGTGARFLIPSLCADCGGRVIVVADAAERARLVDFYEELGKQSALAFSWVFEKGPVVVQLNGDLPEEQARKYEAALP